MGLVESNFLLLFIVLHCLGDWWFQPPHVARGKSRNPRLLAYHGVVYALFMTQMLWVMDPSHWWKWFTTNVGLHVMQDSMIYRFAFHAGTPRWKGSHIFNDKVWCVIGTDQMIHFLVAVWSYGAIPVG